MSESPPLFPISSEEENVSLSVRDMLHQSIKHWPTVLVCLLLVTIVTWTALLLQPPVFESSAKIWVQTEQQGTPSFLSGIAALRESQVPESVNRKIETEIQLMLSRSNVEGVVDRLGITSAQLAQSPLDGFKAVLPAWLRSHRPIKADAARNATVTLFIKNLSVESLRSKTADTTSNVLEARFVFVDQQLGPRALRTLLDQYIQFGSQRNRELGESTYRLIESKVQEEEAKLTRLDGEILAKQLQQGSRDDVAGTGPGSSAVRMSREIDGGASLDVGLTAPHGNSPSSMSLLKAQVMDLQSKLEEAQQLYTNAAPNVIRLRRQLRLLRSRLSEAVQMNAELDTELVRLERQRGLALSRFTQLREKSDQIEMYLQVDHSESESRSIIDPPTFPDKPLMKTRVTIAILGSLAGFLLGVFIAGLREYFDHRLQSSEDVKRYLGLDTLGVLPRAAT